MKCLDVVKEDMQEVGVREDEVFGCGEGGHAGGRSEETYRASLMSVCLPPVPLLHRNWHKVAVETQSNG